MLLKQLLFKQPKDDGSPKIYILILLEQFLFERLHQTHGHNYLRLWCKTNEIMIYGSAFNLDTNKIIKMYIEL